MEKVENQRTVDVRKAMQEAESLKRFKRNYDAFDRNFSWAKNKKIVLYGIGKHTANLLLHNMDYNIIGLCDRDELRIGQKIYGKKIMSQQEAEIDGDILIICTSSSFWFLIYERIKKWSIPIYYLDGTYAPQTKEEYGFEEDSYWENNISKLREEISKYDIITFDIYDTLLMRNVFEVDDLLRIIQEKNKDCCGFYEYRKQVAASSKCLNIDEIYRLIQKVSGWNTDIIERIKHDEIETDRRLTITRDCIVRLLKELINKKKVYLISDMYYTSNQLMEILKDNGLYVDKDIIIVSCEKKRTKRDGSMWNYMREKYIHENKAIHIGDDYIGDYKQPKKFGIDTFLIKSSKELLLNSSLGKIGPTIKSTFTSLVIGKISQKIFNDPFYLCKTNGKVYFNNKNDLGYILLGPIFFYFLSWLEKEASRDDVEELLFFSRDGFFLSRAYDYYLKMKGVNSVRARYIEISRRCAMIAAIKTDEDVLECCTFPYEGTVQEFFFDRFHISFDEPEWNNIPFSKFQITGGKKKDLLKKYMSEIRTRADAESRQYKKYIESLELKGKIAVVDLWLYGTTQHYFSKLIEEPTIGYYFYIADDNRYSRENVMKGCFGNTLEEMQTTPIGKYYAFVESFCTAPNGMLICIDENGIPIYETNGRNQEYFAVREDMFNGILRFIEDMVKVENEMKTDEISSDMNFIQSFYGTLMENGFIVEDEIKRAFYYDNALSSKRETAIW